MVAVTAGMMLLNLIALNAPGNLTSETINSRSKLREQLWTDILDPSVYDNRVICNKTLPMSIMTMTNIEHIGIIDQDAGTMELTLSITFNWIDERLVWNPANYAGIKAITNSDFEYLIVDIYTPYIYMSDLPHSTRQWRLFDRYDVEIVVTHDGVIRVVMREFIKTACNFHFEAFPHDFQNCSFTLFSTLTANEFVFSDFNTANSQYFEESKTALRAQDFRLIDVESMSYFLYYDDTVVEYGDLNKYEPEHCESLLRVNLMLQRHNVFVILYISTPQLIICMMVGCYGLIREPIHAPMIFCMYGIQLLHVISSKDLLPNDFNGTPVIAKIMLIMMVEIPVLMAWRVYVITVQLAKARNDRLRIAQSGPIVGKYTRYDVVMFAENVVGVVVGLQAVINMYIVWHN